MKQASPERPRGRGRAATATAAVLGATLAAYPGGTATAQSDIDCEAIADGSSLPSMALAFEAAPACGFEVRIAHRSEPYWTLYVTPSGQLHVEATADPTGWFSDDERVDPTLMEWDGSLTTTASPWSFWLSYTDTSYPLFFTSGGSLEWTGTKPTPSYADTTAVYDELAAGLDLSVDMDAASAALRFTVDDAEAWQSLAAGLALKDGDGAVLQDGSLHLPVDSMRDIGDVDTTPFVALDAAGGLHAVGLALGDDGALALSLPEGVLDTAVFPMTVTTQWAYSGYGTGEWGVVSSAAPDLAAYRGIGAGTDEGLLEHSGGNGDAGVGPHCNGFADPDCTTSADAASYWSFHSKLNDSRLAEPDRSFDWSFPVDHATFSIDLAADEEGLFTCRTPDLVPVAEYGAAVTWNNQPEAVGDAVAASCEDEVVTYDVTAPVRTAWADDKVTSEVAFGMTESAESARFHGGSARLDVYFDVVGLNTSPWCSSDPTVPDFHSHQVEADLYVEPWRDDLIDLGLTWTGTVKDPSTGETVLTTEPEPVPAGGGTVGSIAPGLPQGAHEIEYQVASSTADVVYTAPPCHVVVDTATPEPAIAVEPGPHRIGDIVSIEVTLGEQDFVTEFDRINLWLHDTAVFDPVDSAALTEAGTAVLEATLTAPVTQFRVQVEDRAGHEFYTYDGLTVAADLGDRDYNGDGLQDLMAVRKSDGALLFHAGNGDGTFAAGVSKGTGWAALDVTMAGDLTGDGKADLLARDTKTGTLYTYPGSGSGGVGTRITVASGWNAMGAFTSAGDFDSDGDMDLYAVSKADGKLYFYSGQGNGSGKFNPRTAIGAGWGVMDALASVGDRNGDGNSDLLAHDSRTGQYYLYLGDGAGNLGSRVPIAASLDGSGSDRYNQIAAVGDQDGDGVGDLVAVDSRTGELELHSFNGAGTALYAGKVVATSWGGDRLAAVNEERTYDYNGDGHSDVVARRSSDGQLTLYAGNGASGWGPATSWGTEYRAYSLIETAGDFDGDGFADLIGRVASTGDLYLFPGKGNGTHDYSARVLIGTSWNAMSAIVSGHDLNGDGKADVLAREKSTGHLWLYEGRGDGKIGSRSQIGTGWNGMREITAVGDLDHDGHADLLAVRSSDGCMYRYGGTGAGTLRGGVKLGCGWNGMDQLAAVGDFDGSGHADFIARRKSDGALILYRGNGAGSFPSAVVGSGWNGMNMVA